MLSSVKHACLWLYDIGGGGRGRGAPGGGRGGRGGTFSFQHLCIYCVACTPSGIYTVTGKKHPGPFLIVT